MRHLGICHLAVGDRTSLVDADRTIAEQFFQLTGSIPLCLRIKSEKKSHFFLIVFCGFVHLYVIAVLMAGIVMLPYDRACYTQ